MIELEVHQVDVFAETVFGGNPLAVFPNAEELTGKQMQQLALEMNLSETTFVLPPTQPDADFKVRIFTPQTELPFAGHPVVGTHWLLASIGRVKLVEPVTTVRFELGVGVLPAELHVKNGVVERVVTTQGKPELGEVVTDIPRLARGLGTSVESIADAAAPPQMSSTGMHQLMVCMRSLDDVRKLKFSKFDLAVLHKLEEELGSDVVVPIAFEAESPDADVHMRGFASMVGIPEDPATGSANGAMGAYLVANGLVDTSSPTVTIRSEQGIEMGRPSRIDIEVDHENRNPICVRVSGKTVPVMKGVIRL